MLILIPIVLGSIFLASCSKSEEPPKKSDPKPEDPPPPPEIDYRRSCLNATCPWDEKQAAIYDYVGSTYGSPGKVQFSEATGRQRLTPAERIYVESTFGRLTGAGEVSPYLTRAHSVFLRQLGTSEPRHCPQVPPVSVSHPRFGEGLVLYGAHGCGEAHAQQLSKSGMELAIAAQPQGWTFFIEGQAPDAPPLTQGAKHEAEAEGKLLARIAGTLQIPLKEALKYNPSHPKVLEEAQLGSNYSRNDFIVANIIILLSAKLTENPRQDQGQLLTIIVEDYAPYFGIDRSDLKKEVNAFLIKYGRDQGPEAMRRMNILLETSNTLSGAALRRELETAATGESAPKSLYLVGLKHLEMVREVYHAK